MRRVAACDRSLATIEDEEVDDPPRLPPPENQPPRGKAGTAACPPLFPEEVMTVSGERVFESDGIEPSDAIAMQAE